MRESPSEAHAAAVPAEMDEPTAAAVLHIILIKVDSLDIVAEPDSTGDQAGGSAKECSS
jgi:hypothetical protein